MWAVKKISIGIASVFLLSSAAAASAAQVSYDLKCEGTSSSLDDSNAEKNSSPFAMTLHVDPDHNTFCQNNCETQEKISRVLPSNIIFRAVNAPLPNRLWVADTGQFSYTWAETAARDEKPSLRSAQGSCAKVMADSGVAVEAAARQKLPVIAAQKPSIAPPSATTPPKMATQARADELSATEITALLDIQNHRPVPASMHTKLYSRGLVHLDNDLWVLTARGEALITGDKR
jgi:hypothetical protein